jgi:nicotinate-nucleotide adenylyltransferase
LKALLGGTFNPVHAGHIAVALAVADAFRLSRIEFVPSLKPVHRDEPQVDAEQRLAMIELATAGHPQLGVNRCEIERGGSSYTVDTLETLHSEAPRTSLCWIMGSDAFNGFSSWKNPGRILELANLIVCARPDSELVPGPFDSKFLGPEDDLIFYDHGRIAFLHMTPNPCSSTGVRQALARRAPPVRCLAPPVLDFIQRNQLYGT